MAWEHESRLFQITVYNVEMIYEVFNFRIMSSLNSRDFPKEASGRQVTAKQRTLCYRLRGLSDDISFWLS